MRRVSGLCLLLLLAWGIPNRLYAAGAIRTFNPPVTKISLSRFEPAPASNPQVLDIAVEDTDKGVGILSQDYDHPRTPRGPYWDAAPFAMAFPQSNDTDWKLTVNPAGFSLLRACGYTSPAAPKASLTYPDAHADTLTGTAPSGLSGCWDFDVQAAIGMQFGIYSVALDHP